MKESITDKLDTDLADVGGDVLLLELRGRDCVVVMIFIAVMSIVTAIYYCNMSQISDNKIILDYKFHVDPNKAHKAELMTLPGIGDKLSQNIIQYRNEKKHFNKPEELRNVDLIGKKKFALIKPFIVIEETDKSE
jgi:competence ComEA-like helix-hairpin-helix protein